MGKKRKHRDVLSGNPIAEKLVARMKRKVRSKVVNLKDVITGRAAAEELQRTVVTKEGLAGFHPAHAAYVYAQNQVSVMSEQLTALDEMAPLADIVSKAEDLHMPSGSPMSPLTTSYFTCWAFFDACVGPTNETIGTTVLEVGAALDMPTELLHLIRLMQESTGLYVHEGTEGKPRRPPGTRHRRTVPHHLPSRLPRPEGRALVRPGTPAANSRWLGARPLHDAVHHAEARAARVAVVLPPHLARGSPAGAPRCLRAPHEVRADAHVLE